MLGKNICDFTYPDIPVLKNSLILLNAADPDCAVLPWAPSAVQTLPKHPVKAAVVCGTNVIKGIAKALNMQLITCGKMTGDVDTDLEEKLSAALKAAREYPFVLLHIGGCDEASHRMNIAQKEQFLMEIDRVILSALLRTNHTIEVVSDHGANPATGKHMGGKQPLFLRIEKLAPTV